eukprot:TRINITY_DN3566_c0_g1_i7.p1 TRINITY_DN3566_c0_g1~~TRINITY_DN3566_c0_g1_i7.p1  ORF type:complete len:615 (+),score=112.94 TRINITY_DN3566_c0_g1_i7:1039-2883(+)
MPAWRASKWSLCRRIQSKMFCWTSSTAPTRAEFAASPTNTFPRTAATMEAATDERSATASRQSSQKPLVYLIRSTICSSWALWPDQCKKNILGSTTEEIISRCLVPVLAVSASEETLIDVVVSQLWPTELPDAHPLVSGDVTSGQGAVALVGTDKVAAFATSDGTSESRRGASSNRVMVSQHRKRQEEEGDVFIRQNRVWAKPADAGPAVPPFSLPRAKWLINFCEMTYMNERNIAIPLARMGFRLMTYLRHPSTDARVFIASDDSQVVVAFCGTDSLKHMWVDCHAAMQQTDWEHPDVDNDDFARVHTGFWRAYLSIKDYTLQNVLQALGLHSSHTGATPKASQAKKKDLFLTGHSLGGALAVLCAVDIKLRLGLDPCVYVFGCPRIGDSVLRDRVNHDVPHLYRINNPDDIVQALPPRGIIKTFKTFRHVGVGIRLLVSQTAGAGSDGIDGPEDSAPVESMKSAVKTLGAIFAAREDHEESGALGPGEGLEVLTALTAHVVPIRTNIDEAEFFTAIPPPLPPGGFPKTAAPPQAPDSERVDVELLTHVVDNDEYRLESIVRRVCQAREGLFDAHTHYFSVVFPNNPLAHKRHTRVARFMYDLSEFAEARSMS